MLVTAIPAAVDWSWPPAQVNTVLRALWSEVTLGPDLRPVAATWTVPELRARSRTRSSAKSSRPMPRGRMSLTSGSSTALKCRSRLAVHEIKQADTVYFGTDLWSRYVRLEDGNYGLPRRRAPRKPVRLDLSIGAVKIHCWEPSCVGARPAWCRRSSACSHQTAREAGAASGDMPAASARRRQAPFSRLFPGSRVFASARTLPAALFMSGPCPRRSGVGTAPSRAPPRALIGRRPPDCRAVQPVSSRDERFREVRGSYVVNPGDPSR